MSRLIAAHNKVRRDSKLYFIFNEVEVAVRTILHTRLSGDLQWVWDKLQGKKSVSPILSELGVDEDKRPSQIMKSLRDQFRKVAALELDDGSNQVDDSGFTQNGTKDIVTRC